MSYRLPRELYRRRWQRAHDELGPDHPSTRSAFGRYVAAVAGRLTQRAGAEAWRAWNRALLQPGYLNRSYRRHLLPDFTVQP